MDTAALRAEFPVLDRFTYLNAGTAGPWPHAASVALRESVEAGERDGRLLEWFMGGRDLGERLRAAYAALLGAPPEEVALTSCTSDGIARVLGGLELAPGDEIITSEGEHPGLLGPLAAAIAQRGVTVREVPFARVADEVGPATRLVACSHVHWATGEVAPTALADLDVPVLLDGAQGIGAVPVRVRELGCAFYAGSGQKWMCGPVGTGMLWVDPAWQERVVQRGPTYLNLDAPNAGLRRGAAARCAPLRHAVARDRAGRSGARVARRPRRRGLGRGARARCRPGRDARDGARRRRARGPPARRTRRSSPGAPTILPPGASAPRSAASSSATSPNQPWLRASTGAWNDEDDLQQLLDAL